jgi:hypothetical protein
MTSRVLVTYRKYRIFFINSALCDLKSPIRIRIRALVWLSGSGFTLRLKAAFGSGSAFETTADPQHCVTVFFENIIRYRYGTVPTKKFNEKFNAKNYYKISFLNSNSISKWNKMRFPIRFPLD